MSPGVPELTDRDYEHLLEVRTALRRFLAWSESRAREAGLTAAQHQLLLAVKGHADSRGPTVGEITEYLCTQPHSVVGLIDRAVRAGLVRRVPDPDDARVVRVVLLGIGEEKVAALAALHLVELQRLAPLFGQVSASGRSGGARDDVR